MRFLKQLGVGDFEARYVEDLLRPLEARYLTYKTKLAKTASDPGDDEEKRELLS